jgi:hypothetical protein
MPRDYIVLTCAERAVEDRRLSYCLPSIITFASRLQVDGDEL